MDLLRDTHPAVTEAPYNRALLVVLAGFVVAAFAAMSWFLTRKTEEAPAVPSDLVSLDRLRQETAQAPAKPVSAKELEKATARAIEMPSVSGDVLLKETSN